MNLDEIWNNFLVKIKSKVSLMSFNYIFKDLKLYSYENSKVIIVLPSNELLLQNITKNYHDIIEEIMNLFLLCSVLLLYFDSDRLFC